MYNILCILLILCFIVVGSSFTLQESFWIPRYIRRYRGHRRPFYQIPWYGRYNPFHSYFYNRFTTRYCPIGCTPSGYGYKCLDPYASCPIGAVGCCQYDYDCNQC